MYVVSSLKIRILQQSCGFLCDAEIVEIPLYFLSAFHNTTVYSFT